MATEIERKFLVESAQFKTESTKLLRITQGYLSSNPERTVRIRLKGDKGYITVKGASSSNGLSRYEWEKEIPASEARELLILCEPGIIDKMRYEVNTGTHIFEVDEFLGDNSGLIMAEVELASEDEKFEKPSWIGTEVTGDSRYYNSYLSKKPFSIWP